jgi:hypothetical protein
MPDPLVMSGLRIPVSLIRDGTRLERKMQILLSRGLNRLFLAMTLLWAILLAVVVPLKYQWDGQMRTMAQYREDVEEQKKLAADGDLGGSLHFGEIIEENRRNALDFYSFQSFWISDVALWRWEIPAIIVPPLVLYGLGMLFRWVWRGFRTSNPPAIAYRSIRRQ